MRVILVFCLVLSLSACGLTKEKLGLSQKSPDEATVESRKPLSLPPEFDVRPSVNEITD